MMGGYFEPHQSHSQPHCRARGWEYGVFLNILYFTTVVFVFFLLFDCDIMWESFEIEWHWVYHWGGFQLEPKSSRSRSDNADGAELYHSVGAALPSHRSPPSSVTNSCTRAAGAAERCPWAWRWAPPWWRLDRCPGSRTSCRRLGRRGVRRSASHWCCLWHWSQRIQILERAAVWDAETTATYAP